MKSYAWRNALWVFLVWPGDQISSLITSLDSSLSMGGKFWVGLWRGLYQYITAIIVWWLITWLEFDPWTYVHAQQYWSKRKFDESPRFPPQWRWIWFWPSDLMENIMAPPFWQAALRGIWIGWWCAGYSLADLSFYSAFSWWWSWCWCPAHAGKWRFFDAPALKNRSRTVVWFHLTPEYRNLYLVFLGYGALIQTARRTKR